MSRKSTVVPTIGFRGKLGDILNLVGYGQVDYIVTRRGRKIAVMISMDAYNEYLDLLERRDG